MSEPCFSPDLVKRCVCTDEQRAEFIAKGECKMGFDPATGYTIVAYFLPNGHILIDEIKPGKPTPGTDRSLIQQSLDCLTKYVRRKTPVAFHRIGENEGAAVNPKQGEHYPAVQSIMDQLRNHLKT